MNDTNNFSNIGIMIEVIISIIISIIILFFLEKNTIEGYDARYTDTQFPQCAEFCKTTSGCYGFGYDKKTKTCYPAQLPIVGRPIDSIFQKEYRYDNTTCNKIKAIELPNPKPTFEDRRSNAVYVCSEAYNMQPQYYLHNKGQFNNIGEGRNIDDIFDIEQYEVRPYTWPHNRFDVDQTDLLYKDRESQLYTPENVTDVNRIIAYTPPLEERDVIKPQPKISIKPVLDFNLDGIKNQIFNLFKDVGPGILIPTSKYEGKAEEIKPIRERVTYREYPQYNTGQFLREYKCIKDTPLRDCLNYCTNTDLCTGVEWNPKFNSDQNVCCPYLTTGEFVDRNRMRQLGKFYQKQVGDVINENDLIMQSK